MGLLDPKVAKSEKFSDHFTEGERFFLTGIRTVTANTDYGQGEMVLLTVQGMEEELGIWGDYLLKQAKDCSPDDLNKWYIITRQVVDGFSTRPVKMIAPAVVPGQADDGAEVLADA